MFTGILYLMVHPVALGINNLRDANLDDFDTASQARASATRSIKYPTSQAPAHTYHNRGSYPP